MASSITSQETFRRRSSKWWAHVRVVPILSSCIGKLTRNEVIKDSVEIEALIEPLGVPDTFNT